mgnify:FL=1
MVKGKFQLLRRPGGKDLKHLVGRSHRSSIYQRHLLREDLFALHIGLADVESLEEHVHEELGFITTVSWSHWRPIVTEEVAQHCILLTTEPKSLFSFLQKRLPMRPMVGKKLDGILGIVTETHDWSKILDLYRQDQIDKSSPLLLLESV